MDTNVKTCPLAESTRPLTWEEFCGMVGKNVYILDTDESPEDGGWFLVDSLETEEDEREEDDRYVWCFGPGDYYGFPKGEYGEDYLAYRFPPYKGCDKEHCGLWDEQKGQCAVVTMALIGRDRRKNNMTDKGHEKQEATSEEKVGGFTVRKGTGIVVQRGMDICPYCEEKHEVETVMMVKIVCIGGENLLAFEFSQYCEKADDFYQTEKQFNESVELEKTIMKTEPIEIAELKVNSETAKMIVETFKRDVEKMGQLQEESKRAYIEGLVAILTGKPPKCADLDGVE